MRRITIENYPSLSEIVYEAIRGEDVVFTDKESILARLIPYTNDHRMAKLKYLEQLTADLLQKILPLALSLSVETDLRVLLEKIVKESQDICNADGGTLYLRTKDDQLKFSIMRTDSLKIYAGGTTGNPITLSPLPMYDKSGLPNESNMATYVATSGQMLNFPDVYRVKNYNIEGAKKFDANHNYRTTSCLTIPLLDYKTKTLGVIQLVNAKDRDTGKIVPFNSYLVEIVKALSTQASAALNNLLIRLGSGRNLD